MCFQWGHFRSDRQTGQRGERTRRRTEGVKFRQRHYFSAEHKTSETSHEHRASLPFSSMILAAVTPAWSPPPPSASPAHEDAASEAEGRLWPGKTRQGLDYNKDLKNVIATTKTKDMSDILNVLSADKCVECVSHWMDVKVQIVPERWTHSTNISWSGATVLAR